MKRLWGPAIRGGGIPLLADRPRRTRLRRLSIRNFDRSGIVLPREEVGRDGPGGAPADPDSMGE